MRSTLAATTLLLILGMFCFQTGYSSAQQPNKESFTNSIGIKLIQIPKGKFLMGSPETEEMRGEDEILHEVTISRNFYMGATEVTQAQWQKVMGINPSKFQGDQLPVEKVSWKGAVEFCNRLSDLPEEKKAGRKYRLPTEAEWEYACRAGTTTLFHFGSELELNGQANMKNTKGPNPVGKYPANAWGLYDMHGNVFEWCSDWYGEYDEYSVTDPSGLATGLERVKRGGCFGIRAERARSASRVSDVPSSRRDNTGFRVALSTSGFPK